VVLAPGAPTLLKRRAGCALLLVGVAVLVVLYVAVPRRGLPPLVITGAAAGTYPLIAYERHYFYWVDARGRHGVDSSFLVGYYSRERMPGTMRDEARRIAPALMPFADSAHLTRLWLRPTKGIPGNALPLLRISYDVKFVRDSDGTWTEVSGW
jgi:hypothetical protein